MTNASECFDDSLTIIGCHTVHRDSKGGTVSFLDGVLDDPWCTDNRDVTVGQFDLDESVLRGIIRYLTFWEERVDVVVHRLGVNEEASTVRVQMGQDLDVGEVSTQYACGVDVERQGGVQG